MALAFLFMVYLLLFPKPLANWCPFPPSFDGSSSNIMDIYENQPAFLRCSMPICCLLLELDLAPSGRCSFVATTGSLGMLPLVLGPAARWLLGLVSHPCSWIYWTWVIFHHSNESWYNCDFVSLGSLENIFIFNIFLLSPRLWLSWRIAVNMTM